MASPDYYKLIYKILSWSTMVGLVATLVLVLRKSPPPDVPFNATAAATAEKKLEAADEAHAAGRPAQVSLDRTELNSYLQQNLQLAPGGDSSSASSSTAPDTKAPGSPTDPGEATTAGSGDPLAQFSGGDQPTLEQVQSSVKDVKVDMDGDLVKAYVIFGFHGKDLSLELDGHLHSEGGYLKFDPVAGKLGSLPLPQSTLQAAVDKLMNSPENRDKLKLPDGVSGLDVEDGQAKVTYGNP
ncbi:MAG TPA: hypothetical protein VMU43_08170 [Candidatus Acidoferrum sp.]|nr:hypothetical protein [Candidatus Acidoferrum sp.]